MIFQGNWVDLVVVAVLLFFVWDGWRRGIFVLLAQLLAFVGAILLAYRLYFLVTPFLMQAFSLSRGLAQAMAFLLTAYVAEEVLVRGLNELIGRIPQKYFPRWWKGIMSVVPSLLSGVVVTALVLSAILAFPIRPRVKQDILASELGGWLTRRAAGWERQVNAVFGEAARETLSFLTTPVESHERVDLGFELVREEYTVDEAAEQEIFRLVNEERVERGFRALSFSSEALVVARGHSEDMARRGYFSHVSPEGEDVGDRLAKAGITFLVAGENLALAPTSELTHQGLMESPGHRENILAPEFSRVAIGVIDAGVYGKMTTQVFLN